MSEEMVVRQAAPTLAGIKTGSLFPCPCAEKDVLLGEIRAFNRHYLSRGLCLLPLRFAEGKALLYLYRPAALQRDLRAQTAKALLADAGYPCGSCGGCVARLVRRMREGAEFPHEIGLFLSYPPEDVKGFIENHAANAKCTGVWKVYGDERQARPFVNAVLHYRDNPDNDLGENWYKDLLSAYDVPALPNGCLDVRSRWYRLNPTVRQGARKNTLTSVGWVTHEYVTWEYRAVH